VVSEWLSLSPFQGWLGIFCDWREIQSRLCVFNDGIKIQGGSERGRGVLKRIEGARQWIAQAGAEG